MQDPKIAKNSPSEHNRTILSGYVFARHISTIGKNLLNSNVSPTCPYSMVKFDPPAAEIGWQVWGISANFNGFRVLAALQHGTRVVAVSQSLRRRTEGATYIRQGGHHVGYWPHSSFSWSGRITASIWWKIHFACFRQYREWLKSNFIANHRALTRGRTDHFSNIFNRWLWLSNLT